MRIMVVIFAVLLLLGLLSFIDFGCSYDPHGWLKMEFTDTVYGPKNFCK